MADTFLGFELDRSSSVLGCPLAGSCPEECIAACLWKAEATTSSSLAAAQSDNCFEFEEKRGMEQECGKKPITFFFPLSLSRLFFCLPLSCFPAHLFIIQSPFHQFMFSPPLQVSDRGGWGREKKKGRGSNLSKSDSDPTCLGSRRLNIKNQDEK